jgi:hypothetical protein
MEMDMAEAIRKPSMESPTSWLFKLKRNQIFEAIQEAGLDPRDFELILWRTGTSPEQIEHLAFEGEMPSE